MLELFKATNNFVWGPPLLLLLVGTGVYFTIRLGLFQLSKLPTAFRLIFSSDQSGQGDVSSFAALCTALAATVGTGNIVGVATAITYRWSGSPFLDVGCCILWYGNEVCGRISSNQVQN